MYYYVYKNGPLVLLSNLYICEISETCMTYEILQFYCKYNNCNRNKSKDSQLFQMI